MPSSPTRRDLLAAAAAAGTLATGESLSRADAAAGRSTATPEAVGDGPTWQSFQGGARNAGGAAGRAAPRLGASFQWRGAVEHRDPTGVAVAEGSVVFGAGDGTVGALWADSGERRWVRDVGASVRATPAVADGAVVVGDEEGRVTALALADGSLRWQLDVGAPVLAGATAAAIGSDGDTAAAAVTRRGDPTATGDAVAPTVLVGTLGGTVVALGLERGGMRWSRQLDGEVRSPAAVADGSVYVWVDDQGLRALRAGDGGDRWTFDATGPWGGAPTVAGDLVLVGGEQTSALSTADGSVRWAFRGGRRSSMAVGRNSVFVPDRGDLYAVSLRDGEERWQFESDGVRSFAPAVAGDTVYLATEESLHGIGAATGAERWAWRSSRGPRAAPAVAGERLFVAGDEIYALGPDPDATPSPTAAPVTVGNLLDPLAPLAVRAYAVPIAGPLVLGALLLAVRRLPSGPGSGEDGGGGPRGETGGTAADGEGE